MSRLDSYRQRQFNRKVLFFLILLVGLIIFISTIGFNLLVNTGEFIGNLTASKKSDNAQQANFYGSFEVDAPASATNSAQLVITGSSSNYDNLDFYINDHKVKTAKAQDIFSEEIGSLTKGSNTIYVKASTRDLKNRETSETFTVLYSDTKPKLEVTQPADNTKTSNPDITVSGKTDPGVTVKVNDFPTVVDASGNFQTSVRLTNGDNKITITVQDDAGNTDKKEITVHYEKDG